MSAIIDITAPLNFTMSGESLRQQFRGAPTGQAIILGPTSPDGQTTLIADAAEFATKVRVADPSAFAPGKLIQFAFDNPVWIAQQANCLDYRFVSRVVGVVGDEIEFADNLPQPILCAWPHWVKAWTPATELDMALALDMAGASAGAMGIRVACVADSTLDLFAKNNDGTGYGVNIEIAYRSQIRMRARRCGGPSQAALTSRCVTGGRIETMQDDAVGDGFGVVLNSLHYARVDDLGGAHTSIARLFKTTRQRFNSYYGSHQVNPSMTGLAIDWATQNCKFIGFGLIGSNRTSAQNIGVWTGSAYCTGNSLVSSVARGNTAKDIQVNATDSLHVVDCDVGRLDVQSGGIAYRLGGSVDTVTGAGVCHQIAHDKFKLSGPNIAQFYDPSGGWPVVLVGTTGASVPAYLGVNGAGDFRVWTNAEALRVTRADPAANKASLFIRANDGTTVAQKQVEIGAPDSAGTGYRTLRIAN